MNLQPIQESLAAMRAAYQSQAGARDLLIAQQLTLTDRLADTRRDVRLLDQELALLSHVSRSMMDDLTHRIEEPVTAALQLLWEDDRLFKFNFGTYRNEPAAWREIWKREGEGEYQPFDPDEQSGGGVSDIVSFILDLSIREMVDPRPQGIMSRDEPAKHVDRQGGDQKTKNIAYFLKEYVRRTGVQFIFITHNSELAKVADMAYEVRKVREMTSEVVRVK